MEDWILKQTSEFIEKRTTQRVSKEVKVETNRLTYPLNDDDISSGTTKNLSREGALLKLNDGYDNKTLLQIRITLPGWRKSHPGFIRVYEDSIGSPFTAICEVIRSKKSGDAFETAVKFINVDIDDLQGLNGYLEKQISN
jgi:PilZ domain